MKTPNSITREQNHEHRARFQTIGRVTRILTIICAITLTASGVMAAEPKSPLRAAAPEVQAVEADPAIMGAGQTGLVDAAVRATAIPASKLAPRFAPGDDAPAERPNHPPLHLVPPMPMPVPPAPGFIKAAPGAVDTSLVYDAQTRRIVELPANPLAGLSGLPGNRGGGAGGADGGGPPPESLVPATFGNMTRITTTGDFPWRMNCKLLMRFVDQSGVDRYFVCSGSMIEANVVLTAAHCVYARNPNGINIFDWAREIWVYPGWDGTGTINPPDTTINTHGWARGTYYLAGSDYINNGNFDRDSGLICIGRPVGMLTGWFGWAWGFDCATIQSRTYNNSSFPAEGCGSPGLHNGRDMYYWFGGIDSCPGNQARINTSGGCFNAGWGGMSGSSAYWIDGDNRFAHAVASTSDRASVFNFCKLWEQFVLDMNNIFIPTCRGTTFDLQPLDCNFGPTVVQAGSSMTLQNHLAANATGGTKSGTHTFTVYLSSNDNISSGDTPLSTQSYTWNFAAASSVRVNMASFNIPLNTPPGTYWLGVEYDAATDASFGNNGSDGWDAVQITVTAPPAPPNDNFASRLTLSGSSGATAGSNTGATKETGEPNHFGNPGGKSVWWQWTAPASGTVAFDTFGSTYDTLLAVYTGTAVNALTEIASNDDSGGLQSRVSFAASSGTSYKIAVDGFNGSSGDITLNWAIDTSLPTVTVAASDPIASETAPNPGVFTVSRAGSTAAALTVNFTVGGTASSGSDYTALGSSLVIGAGLSSATVTVTPSDDATVEAAETVILTLASGSGYTVGSPSSASVTIEDNDGAAPAGWEGMSQVGSLRPPDPHGTAGPNGILQAINLRLAYYTKAGSLIWGPVNFSTLFAGVGNTGTGISDPRALYDPANGRFYVILQENLASQSFLNVAVSKNSNPATSGNSDWYFYRLDVTETSAGVNYGIDYPGLGFDGQAVYVTYNMYQLPLSGSPKNCQIIVLNKAAITSGTPTYHQVFTADGTANAFTLQPATVIGAGSPGNVAYFGETSFANNTSVRLWALADPLGARTLTSSTITVPSHGGFISGAPQLGTATTIPTLSPRTQGNAFWRNGEVWFCHTAGGGSGKSSVYYYRVAANNYPSGTPTLAESGSIDGGSGVWTFQPSIGGNANGDACIVYMESSSAIYPTIKAVTRTSAATAFGAPTTLKVSPSFSNSDRWGDYASVTADPADNCFWVTHEFSRSSALHDWGTWWARVCASAGPVLPIVTITASDADAGEPSNNGHFTVTRTGSTAAPLTVNFTVGGTASGGVDYASIGTSVIIPASAASVLINVTVIDDLLVEGSETVIATLAANAAYTVGSPASATVTITDNDTGGGPTPIAHWMLDETGSLSALDSIGANHGTLVNGPLRVAGRVGPGAVAFDGVNDHINVPDSPVLRLSSTMTFAFWFNPSQLLNASSGRKDLLQKFLSYWLLLNYPSGDGKLTFVLNSGSPTVKSTTASWSANTWYHVAATYDGAQMKLYVNGALEGTAAATVTPVGNANPLQFGGNSSQSFFFPGALDDVRLYGRALTAAEVLALTTGGSPSCLALTPPSPQEFGGTPAPDGGVVAPRGAFVTALNNFTITALGIEGDLTVPSLTLVANIYAASGLTRGALLATASSTLSDAGAGFYDVPINFTFNAGTDYDLSLSFVPGADLLVRFFEFDPVNFGSPPYDIGGVVRVRDGEADGASGNTVLPHLRLCLGSAPALPTVTITASDPNAGEPADPGQFTVTRTGSTASPLTVNFTIGGTAASGTDYSSIGTSVTIPATAASAVVNVAVLDDLLVEGSETVIATLAANAAYTIGSPASATVTITDNDTPPVLPTVTITASDANAGEPADAGQFTVARTGSTAAALTVNFTIGGTATAGTDYNSIGTSVTIPASAASAVVNVAVLDDLLVEGSETVIATLAANAAYTIGSPASATVTITDNDTPPVLPTVTITASDANAGEPTDAGQFTVARTGSTAAPLTVNFTVGGTASSGVDYTSIGTSVTIPASAASAVVNVAVLDDLLVEGSETVIATLAANAAYTIGSPASATVTIADNEPSVGPTPIAHWMLDETGSLSALDSIGANHGTLVNGPLRVAGRVGPGAVAFDGVNDHINVPDSPVLRLSSTMTFAFWFNPSQLLNASSGRKDILQKFLSYWLLLNYPSNDGKLTFILNSGSPTVKSTTASWSANTWYHVAATYDGAQMKLYVNGALEGTAATTVTPVGNANPLQFGGNTSQSFFFPGALDDIRLYGQALTAAEVLALTTGGPSSCLALTPPNPVEFGGTPAPDGGVVTPRGAFVTALNNFTITAVGVEGDLTVPSLTLVANIYAASGLTRGTLLATASRTLTDAGVGFYDVPINFTFNAGTDYDISLSFAPAADLLVRFFEFDPVNFASPPFDIGGVVRVRDGEADNGVSANFVLPHLRLCLGSAPVPPTVTITANDADAGEPSNNGQFTVARTGSTAAPLTVNFTVGGTASSGVDYTSIGTSVIIPATAASAVVNVTVIDDLLVEASETVIATLAANAAYTVDSPSSATVTIGDNDTACLSELKNLRDVRLNFGGVATTCPATVAGGQLVAGTFDCDMSNPAGSTARHRVAIGFRTSSGQGIGQIREIPSLNSVPSCPLTVRNDVTLPADVGVDTTPGTYSLWVESYLTENDPTVLFAANPHTAEDNLRKILCVVTVPLPTVTITASDSNAAEPSDPGQFTVTRTGSTASPLTVNFTVGGTASSGADYTAIGTSVVIPATAASAVINVNVIDDLLVEGSETVVATLAANAAYTVGSPASATVTITDNDAPAGPVPVARWRFDETSGATALDSIGVNHGTLINGPLRVAGINNGALSFDGVNDYVNVPDAAALDLPAACSISLWIKPASLLNASSGRKDLLKKFLAYWILLNYPSNDGKLTFVLQSGSPTVKTLTSSWAANTWYHIVCTHDGAQIKIYVNGVHEATTTTTILIPNNANPLQIGGNSDQSFWFPSVIDEVRLYHSALSVAQVQSLYGNPGASSPALSIVLQRELITSGAMDAGAPGAKIILRWNAEPGRVYRVQFTDRLNDPEWQEVPVSIKPEGTSGLYEDKTAAPAQRFYRVIEVP